MQVEGEIYKTQELSEETTTRNFRVVQNEGKRKVLLYPLKCLIRCRKKWYGTQDCFTKKMAQ